MSRLKTQIHPCYNDMIYDTFVNCNWVVTRWRWYDTHLHKNNTQNDTNNNRTTQKTIILEECGPCPFFASFTPTFALQLRIKHGKTSAMVKKSSVRVSKTSLRAQYTYYKNTHTLQKLHTYTYTQTRARVHILQNPHIHTPPHINQYKTTTVQIKTNTIQDTPK